MQDLIVPTEKPRNGLAGLKHWRYDLRSGFTVAMISLPFSMGIAITSGAPPICGILSAIIAGFVLPFLGGSYVTISAVLSLATPSQGVTSPAARRPLHTAWLAHLGTAGNSRFAITRFTLIPERHCGPTDPVRRNALLH